MGDFGAVTYEQPATDAAGSAGGTQHDEAIVDINDPRLTSEAIDINQDADAYAIPNPAPDGKWRAKLKQLDIKDGNGQPQRYIAKSFPKMSNGKPFLVTNVEASLIDLGGKYDGVKLTEYWVKTLVDERNGTSQAATITLKAGGSIPPKATDADQMASLLKVLATEPEVIVETAWEASCQACQEAAKKSGQKSPKPFLRGEHRFPQMKVGGVMGHDPNVACPTCKSLARAQVRIVRYWSVKEGKADRGL